MKKTAVEIEKIFNMDEPIGFKDTLQSALLRIQDAVLEGMMAIPESKYPPNLDFPGTKETWVSAQSALLADPMVIDLRGVECPEWANGITVEFTRETVQVSAPKGVQLRYIPRPVPAWQPKEGEAVFITRDCETAEIAKFCQVGVSGIMWVITTIKGQDQGHFPDKIKPFDPTKIGLPWSKI